MTRLFLTVANSKQKIVRNPSQGNKKGHAVNMAFIGRFRLAVKVYKLIPMKEHLLAFGKQTLAAVQVSRSV